MNTALTGDISALFNLGIDVLRDAPREPFEKTVVVLGPARSGTSMIAGALSYLGVHMCDKKNDTTFEDSALSLAVENGRSGAVNDLIKERNEKFPVWGWKRPSSIKYIAGMESMFRNPLYVVVFRDVFAIAHRNKISMGTDTITNMQFSLEQYSRIINFIGKSTAPCMMVSYDKALANKELFVHRLARFVGMGNKQLMQAALDFIQLNPPKYLDVSRFDKCHGFLGKVTRNRVLGWAKRNQKPSEPVEVQLLVDGKEIMTVTADVFRKDVLERKMHPTGRCGFEFRLPEHLGLKEGQEVRVKAVADRYDLANSPVIFNPGKLPVKTWRRLGFMTRKTPRQRDPQ